MFRRSVPSLCKRHRLPRRAQATVFVTWGTLWTAAPVSHARRARTRTASAMVSVSVARHTLRRRVSAHRPCRNAPATRATLRRRLGISAMNVALVSIAQGAPSARVRSTPRRRAQPRHQSPIACVWAGTTLTRVSVFRVRRGVTNRACPTTRVQLAPRTRTTRSRARRHPRRVSIARLGQSSRKQEPLT